MAILRPLQDEERLSTEVELSLVIPVFNEEESLPDLFDSLRSLVEALDLSVEILLVDDGSRDRSWRLIEEASAEDPHFAGVRLSRNFGHQMALSCGYELARGEAIVSIDADLQDPPEVVLLMVEKWREGADVVLAVRSERRGESWFKRASAKLFYRLLRRLTATNVPLDVGDFRLMSRRSLDALNRLRERHRFVRGMVGWVGFRTAEVHYVRQPRRAGTTKYPFWKMARLATDAIVSMSYTPLRLAYLLAAMAAIPFLGYLLYNVLLRWVWEVEMVPGWSSLILAITVFGTAILFFLGVMGEYLGRVYEETKRRPLYLISEVVGAPGARGAGESGPRAHNRSISHDLSNPGPV